MSLLKLKKLLKNVTLSQLFHDDPKRFEKMHIYANGLILDYSKQKLTIDIIQALCDKAKQSSLNKKIDDLFNGAIVNLTEQQPALHTELRNPKTNNTSIKYVLNKISDFVKTQSKMFTDVIILGIGGSDLGPRLVCEALKPYKVNSLNLHFIANIDANTLIPLISKLNAKKTLCIINSKTFTTIETFYNANIIRHWLKHENSEHNILGVTANKSAAISWGIKEENIFEFWDWVGGRFSVWSAVGLPIALSIGMNNFERFLYGAYTMDQHFYHAEFIKNMPVIMALIGIWNINYLNNNTLAIMPYSDGLQLLPAYLQQLEMESNGKSAKQLTSPVIWGGVGCNGQHSYMQMLHQGTQIVPVDFFIAVKSNNEYQELQDLLIASCLGQSKALMQGCKSNKEYKFCPGNRPSTTIMFEKITPEIVGSIIALYEHKVYVQGIIWDIQSFDQWGVQLGKDLIKELLIVMKNKNTSKLDSSTTGLFNYYSKFNNN